MRPISPESIEFIERAQRVFAPQRPHGGCVKAALAKLQDTLGILPHRARDLMRGKIEPKVREMDKIRELDGVWCNRLKRAKARIEDKIEDIWETIQKFKPIAERMEKRKAKREARLSNKSIIERMYQDNRA
jgi:hypothetical protein